MAVGLRPFRSEEVFKDGLIPVEVAPPIQPLKGCMPNTHANSRMVNAHFYVHPTSLKGGSNEKIIIPINCRCFTDLSSPC